MLLFLLAHYTYSESQIILWENIFKKKSLLQKKVSSCVYNTIHTVITYRWWHPLFSLFRYLWTFLCPAIFVLFSVTRNTHVQLQWINNKKKTLCLNRSSRDACSCSVWETHTELLWPTCRMSVLCVLARGCALSHVRVYWPQLVHERSAWGGESPRSTNGVRRWWHRTRKARIM